jgi:hypothetical protein
VRTGYVLRERFVRDVHPGGRLHDVSV